MAFASGPIWTPLIPSTFPKEEAATFESDVPLDRPGQPEEIAPSCVFPASDDSSYMTGQIDFFENFSLGSRGCPSGEKAKIDLTRTFSVDSPSTPTFGWSRGHQHTASFSFVHAVISLRV
jgi:hypothetical protein